MDDNSITWFLPEHITHLYYSPIYATLSLQQRLAYNRLHACYHCEFCAFLESELPRYYLRATELTRTPQQLRQAALALADSEKWHAAAFRSLARRISPALYSSSNQDVFVRPQPASSVLFRTVFGWSALRPAFLWIALIQEERGAYFSHEVLRMSAQLDPRMVDWQRKHLEDESDHIGLGETLLPLYWEASPPWVRRINGWLVRFLLREFFSAPKRSGLRVIEHLVSECPELLPRKSELMQAMRDLDHRDAFHESVYSRRIVPKTFALFDRYAEFHDLGRGLVGYSRQVAQ